MYSFRVRVSYVLFAPSDGRRCERWRRHVVTQWKQWGIMELSNTNNNSNQIDTNENEIFRWLPIASTSETFKMHFGRLFLLAAYRYDCGTTRDTASRSEYMKRKGTECIRLCLIEWDWKATMMTMTTTTINRITKLKHRMPFGNLIECVHSVPKAKTFIPH